MTDPSINQITDRYKAREHEIKGLDSNNDENTPNVTVTKAVEHDQIKEPSSSTSVKRLRKRWEISSTMGTSLHPDKSPPDDLLKTAIVLSGKGQFDRPLKRVSQTPNEPPKRAVLSPRIPCEPKSLASILTVPSGSGTPLHPGTSSNLRAFAGVDRFDVADNTQTSDPPSLSSTSSETELSAFEAKKKQLHESIIVQQDPICQASKELLFCRQDELFNGTREQELHPSSPHPLPNIIATSAGMSLGVEGDGDSPKRDEDEPVKLNSTLSASYHCHNEDRDEPDSSGRITPNTQILGSLMEEINRRLIEEKKSISDGGDSPKSHPRNERTISNYRKLTQSMNSSDSEYAGFERFDVTDNTQTSDPSSLSSISSEAESSAFEAKKKQLHESIIVQQDQICQASRALLFCRQNELFRGKREEIDAERALLIATQRRVALLTERDRLLNTGLVSSNNSTDPTGTVSITHIAVKLSRDFLNSCMHQSQGASRYHFMVLIRCGENVLHTTITDAVKGLKSGFIEFAHCISLSNLSPDFLCEIEVYALFKPPVAIEPEKKMGTMQKLIKTVPFISPSPSGTANTFSSRLIDHKPMDSSFRKIGHLTLNRGMISRQKFLLVDVAYPLDGSIILNMKCFPKVVDQTYQIYRNFMSVYQMVDGYGSWPRFWCVLGNFQLKFYRYPEDEEIKPPELVLDLEKCLSPASKVSPLSASISSFSNSIHLEFENTNGNQRGEPLGITFAADTNEIREQWLTAINKTIQNASIWKIH